MFIVTGWSCLFGCVRKEDWLSQIPGVIVVEMFWGLTCYAEMILFIWLGLLINLRFMSKEIKKLSDLIIKNYQTVNHLLHKIIYK